MVNLHPRSMLAALLALGLALSPTATACARAGRSSQAGGRSAPADGRPLILATTSIWADVVANVACQGQAHIESLLPPGVDPHTAELSLADRGRLDRAGAVVANGLGLESRLGDAIHTVGAAGTPVFQMADHLAIMERPAGEAADSGAATEERQSGGDPHVWFDPVRVSSALPDLAAFLAESAGLDRAELDACVASYQTQLAATDAEITAVLGAVPPERRKLVTNHDALGYYAARYALEVIGTVIPSASTLAAASPAQMETLAATIAEAGVPAIFAETQDSRAEADGLARRVGAVKVVALYTDSLGPLGSGAETYLGLLTVDAHLIADALG
jgi:zinc/manganese transport system substrate-binding protein